MSNDEQQIRQVVTDWMDATRLGDTAAVLALMTEDVIFLVPGREPMRKAEFAALSQAQQAGPKIDGHSEIQEVIVAGDWAFMWSKLAISVTPPTGETMKRAGHTLTVFRKEADGKSGTWRLARDANLLAPVA